MHITYYCMHQQMYFLLSHWGYIIYSFLDIQYT